MSFKLQYTMVESNCRMKRIILPNQPSHDELFAAATVLTCEAAVLAATSAASMVEDRVSEDSMLTCVKLEEYAV